jgi:hypothetical protein
MDSDPDTPLAGTGWGEKQGQRPRGGQECESGTLGEHLRRDPTRAHVIATEDGEFLRSVAVRSALESYEKESQR